MPLPDPAAPLRCETCGRPPDPPRSRRTVVSLLAMLPLELAANVAGITSDLPLPAKVAALTLVTSVLGTWVAEPSALRLLHRWMHMPTLRHRRRLEATALWRVRTVLDDGPGSLDRLTRALARLDANILSIDVHPLADHAPGSGALDELVLAAPPQVGAPDLLDALAAAGGQDCRVWATTALALADGQTRALLAAARVAADPGALARAAADLLGADPAVSDPAVSDPAVSDPAAADPAAAGPADPACALLLDGPGGTVRLVRPGDPFTPAESARAHRLAELAELVAAGRR